MFRFILSFVFAVFIVLFFTQGSLIYYLEQRFHTDFGLEESLKNSVFWRGSEIFSAFGVFIQTSVKIIKNENSQNLALNILENSKNSEQNLSANFLENSALNFLENSNPHSITEAKNSEQNSSVNFLENNAINNEIIAFNQNLKINIRNENNITKSEFFESKPEISSQSQTKQTRNLPQKIDEKIRLKSGEGVLFIGDSLMQYIGANAKKIMPSKNLKVTDLSKQSTGLIDRKGHNWNEALKAALIADKNIKLVVVLLGANDVWGRSIDGKFRDIFTDEWQQFYKTRVSDIYETSKNHGANVLWLSMPCMKKPEFEKKTSLLNEIYSSLNAEFNEYFLNTSDIICLNSEYQTHILSGTKKVKARQDDGIHMTNVASALIADEILKRIEIE